MTAEQIIKKMKPRISANSWRDFNHSWKKMKKEWDKRTDRNIARDIAKLDLWRKENYPTFLIPKKND